MVSSQSYSAPPIRGSIEVITGSMFSGKTEELIRRLRRAELAGLGVLIFKPSYDSRYHTGRIVSHDQNSIPCESVNTSSEIPRLIQEKGHQIQVIGIDEAQFFDPEIIEIVRNLSFQNYRVIIAGLDMDFLGNPFGPMPALMAVAEDVTKARAICSDCGNEATFSFRHHGDSETWMLGAQDQYRPLCRSCFNRISHQP